MKLLTRNLVSQQPTKFNRIQPSIAEAFQSYSQSKSNSIFINHHHLDNTPNLQSTLSLNSLTNSILNPFTNMDHHDHSTMDHSTMDHSMHHDMDTNAMRRCSMNMIFNWDATGTCIVFRRFYVSGTTSLIIYMILLFLLSIGYEYMRLAATRYDCMTRIKLGMESNSKRTGKRTGGTDTPNRNLSSASSSSNENHESIKAWGKVVVPKHLQLTRSLFYVANIAVSFFLMLVVMTYNAQIIAAVLAGAFVGHFIFHRELSYEDGGKGMACH